MRCRDCARDRPGLDGYKAVEAILIGQGPSCPGEVRVERRGMVISRVRVSSRCIRLPYLNQAIRNRVAITVQHSSSDNNAFSQRFPSMLNREITFVRMNIGMSKHWSCYF